MSESNEPVKSPPTEKTKPALTEHSPAPSVSDAPSKPVKPGITLALGSAADLGEKSDSGSQGVNKE